MSPMEHVGIQFLIQKMEMAQAELRPLLTAVAARNLGEYAEAASRAFIELNAPIKALRKSSRSTLRGARPAGVRRPAGTAHRASISGEDTSGAWPMAGASG